MGYQETLITAKNKDNFDKILNAYRQAENEEYYEECLAEPLSVVTLKKNYKNFKKGKQFLWFGGDRWCQITLEDFFGKAGKNLKHDSIEIIAIEDFIDYESEFFDNIDFSIDKDENKNIIRESIKLYKRVDNNNFKMFSKLVNEEKNV
jgi:hypothetical protein